MITESYRRYIFITLSATIPFLAYLITLAPSVVFFDSGELITASFLMTHSHPPGYPLYAMASKWATFFPFGSVAFKVNMMSAFFSSLSCLMVFFITSHILRSIRCDGKLEYFKDLASLAAALSFAFSYNFWNQAVLAEVYPLNTFMAGLLIYLLLLWKDLHAAKGSCHVATAPDLDPRLLYLSSFLLGLGLGNHHTLLVVIPVILFIAAATYWRLFLSIRSWAICLTFFFLGLSIYLLLPMRALLNPELNWGDPDTSSKFKWVFFREGYPKASLGRTLDLFREQLKTFDIIYEFSGVGLIIGCFGIIAYIREKLVEVIVTAIVLIVLSLGIIIYGNPIKENIFLIESFHTPSYMIFSIWIGAGIFFILELLSRFKKDVFEPVSFRTGISGLMLALPLSLFIYFLPWNDKSNDFIAFDYAQNELLSMASNSILFTWGDSGAFPLWYLQTVERYQPNLLLIHTPHLSTKWFIDELPDTVRKGQLQWIQSDDLYAETIFMIMLRENYEKYPLYIDYSTRYSVPVEGFLSIPQGMIYKLDTDIMRMTDVSIWDKYSMRDIYRKDPFRDLDTGKAVHIYANTMYDNALHLIKLGYTDEAYARLSEVTKISPAMREQVRDIMLGGTRVPEGHP